MASTSTPTILREEPGRTIRAITLQPLPVKSTTASTPIADRFHIHNDYGNVEGTRRQRFLLTGLYQLPFGQGRAFMNTGGWRNAILGGWQMTTVTLLETGPWLTPSISNSYDQSNTNVVNRGALLAS